MTRGRFLPAGALAAALLAGCGALPPTAPPASFAPVLTRALPSVVGIYALQRREDCEGADAATRDIDEPHVGAGFVIDREGRIATAAHIIDEAECIVVRYADGRVAEARPLVVDRPSDIAVLAAPAGMAPVAPVGRSAALRPGDWVLAVGEPFGLGRSVSAGVVGATDRHFVEDEEIVFIQSDVSVNPGVSGGPLLDGWGNVVGMNVRMIVSQAGTAGLSLSLPVELVLRTARHASEQVPPARLRLGADFTDPSPIDSFASRRSDTRGVLILSVHADGVAQALGLRSGDVLVSFNGRAVSGSGDLVRQLLAWQRPGGTRATVIRAGRKVHLQVPDDARAPVPQAVGPGDAPGSEVKP